ncbi:MAG: hypothetical protein H7841_16810 [Magnetospirillum sp. WYHS-4]
MADSELPDAPFSFTAEACDAVLARCMTQCEKDNPMIAGDMLCTGCGFSCFTAHKKCLAKSWYEKMFGKPTVLREGN